MTDPINTQNRLRGSTVGTDSKASAAGNSARGSRSDSTRSGSSGESAIVELSNATVLQELRDQIDALPEINEARVEAIKRSLSNGEYHPDAEIIARKYSEIEKLLP